MVKRYDLNEFDHLQEFKDGSLVDYYEYKKLEEENKKLKEDVKQLVRELHMS